MPPAGFIVATRSSGARGKDELLGVDADGQNGDALLVDRRMLIAVLKRRAQRARRFRTLPVTAAFFVVFICAMLSRTGIVLDTYTFEKNILVNVISTDPDSALYPESTTLTAWLAFIAGPAGVIDTVLVPGAATPGALPGFGLVAGGVVLTQRRTSPGPCPYVPAGVYSAFLPASDSSCATTGGVSLAPFGELVLAPSDASLAVNSSDFSEGCISTPTAPAFNDGVGCQSCSSGNSSLAAAFVPSSAPSDPASDAAAFHWWISASEPPGSDSASAAVNCLVAAGWVDGYTASLELSFAVINPELGRIGYVTLSAAQTPGGLAEASWMVRTFPLDPYAPGPLNVAAGINNAPFYPNMTATFDVFVCLYLVYLYYTALRRTTRACMVSAYVARGIVDSDPVAGGECCGPCCGRRNPTRDIDGSVSQSFLGSLWTRLVSTGFALDWGTVAALTATAVMWGAFASSLATLRGALEALPSVLPDVSGAPGPGSVGQPPPWATVEVLTAASAGAYNAWRTSAVWALIFLSMRMFKTFMFHKRLGVLGATLASSLTDIVNMGGLMAIPFSMYGVWGHFIYGTQIEGWSSVESSVTTFFRFIMYDYDWLAMRGVEPSSMTDFFYCSFMMLVTNLFLWIFLAVVFDSYASERLKSHSWPSFAAETRAFIASTPFMLPASIARHMPDSYCSCSRSGGSRGLSAGRQVVAWGEVIDACDGALRHLEFVSPEELVRVLGMAPEAAALLVADVATAARMAVAASDPRTAHDDATAAKLEAASKFYGFGLPGGPVLPEHVLARLRASYPALAAAHAEALAERARASAAAPAADGNAHPDEHDRRFPPVLQLLSRSLTRRGKSAASLFGSAPPQVPPSGSGGANDGASTYRVNPLATALSSPRNVIARVYDQPPDSPTAYDSWSDGDSVGSGRGVRRQSLPQQVLPQQQPPGSTDAALPPWVVQADSLKPPPPLPIDTASQRALLRRPTTTEPLAPPPLSQPPPLASPPPLLPVSIAAQRARLGPSPRASALPQMRSSEF